MKWLVYYSELQYIWLTGYCFKLTISVNIANVGKLLTIYVKLGRNLLLMDLSRNSRDLPLDDNKCLAQLMLADQICGIINGLRKDQD
jgi:hypothetical protein